MGEGASTFDIREYNSLCAWDANYMDELQAKARKEIEHELLWSMRCKKPKGEPFL